MNGFCILYLASTVANSQQGKYTQCLEKLPRFSESLAENCCRGDSPGELKLVFQRRMRYSKDMSMFFIQKPDRSLKRVYYCCLNGWTAAHNLQKTSSNWGRTAGSIVVGVCLSFAVQSLAVSPGDVVINEIAWMGTAASSSDEWIELANNTDQVIDLTGWSLAAADGTPTIALSEIIPAAGFILLERTDDTCVFDIAADLIYGTNYYSWALGNSGEHIFLKDAAGQVVDEVNAGSGWFAGAASPAYCSMERANPAASGNESANWKTNNAAIARNGIDAASNPIGGTPKAQNSATNPPTANFTFIPEQPTTWDAVQFSDQSTDTDGTVIAWLWAFGDGGSSIETNPTHWYELPGTYRTTLEVSDNDGLKGSIFKDVQVSLGPGDVDGSGVLDVLDVRIVLQAALGLITLLQDQVLQADVDGDGEVTKADAQRLSAHIIGIRE